MCRTGPPCPNKLVPQPSTSETTAVRTRASCCCALLAALAITVAGLWWVTTGNFRLFEPSGFGNVYEAQARSLWAGHTDISCDVATGEAFVRNGKCYVYFGPVPGFLRGPLLWLAPNFDGRWSRTMVWVSHLFFLVAVGLILTEAGHPFGAWTSTFYLLLTAFGSTIPGMWGWPTTWVEAISWAVALAAASLYCLLKWTCVNRGAWLIAACLLAMLSFFTRISTGAGPLLAVGLVSLHALWRKPRSRGAAAATLLLVGLSAYLFVALNYARMGTYLNAVPIHLHVAYSAERLARIGGTLIHPENSLSILLNYLLDPPRFRGSYPWLEFRPTALFELTGMDFVDLHAGVLPSMPALVWLAWAGWRSSQGQRVRWLLLAPLAGVVLLVTVAAIAQRYVHEFLLVLAPAGAYGLSWAMASRPRRWITYVLSAWSVYAGWTLALVEQRETMNWTSNDALDRHCTLRSSLDEWLGQPHPLKGAPRVKILQTGSLYEFDGSKWQRCAGPPAHLIRVRIRFAAPPDRPFHLLSAGKAPDADTVSLELSSPGRYRVRMGHPGRRPEFGSDFELVAQRDYLFECLLERANERVTISLDGVVVGHRKTGPIRWDETEVTVNPPGYWLSD